ncbi:MAG: hypothetical protein Fur0037_14680 [Planctomycetota bacterium]
MRTRGRCSGFPSGTLLGLALLAAPRPAPAQGAAWDVPHRGALVYRRETEVFRLDPPASRLQIERVIAPAGEGGHEWRYLSCDAEPQGFESPGFDDSAWATGLGMFAPETDQSPERRTNWDRPVLCLRTRVDLGRMLPKMVLFSVHHDDGIRIYCNGRLVVTSESFGRDRRYVVQGEDLKAFERGVNSIAARCVNTGGAQYCDIAMSVVTALPAGVRSGEDLLAFLDAEKRETSRVRADLFGAFRPPPLLLEGELDSRQQAVRLPPGDLRDLGWYAAMDLGRAGNGGGVSTDLSRLFRVGDLALRGRASPTDADGWQTIELQVRSPKALALGSDSKRFVERYVLPHVLYSADGVLRVRRRIQGRGDRLRVSEFHTDMALDLRKTGSRDSCGRLVQVEHWTLDSARENQDSGFRLQVAEALERGTRHLRARLKNLRQAYLAPADEDAANSYSSGRLALCALALIKGGVPRDDEVLLRCMDELRRRKLVDTYSLANALMALEAFYAPANEFGDLKQGVIDRPRPRVLPPEDLALMRRWTEALLENVDTRTDPAYVLRFNYTRGPRYDHSVNQYGLLGLYSAHLCGVELPSTVWEAAGNNLIATQGKPEAKIDLELVDYRTFARMQSDPFSQRTSVRQPVRAAGWFYQDPREGGEDTPRYGSMTCAGITGLAICQAGIESMGLKRARWLSDVARARNAGFAWLAEHFQTRYHPGDIGHQQHWIYYYLYGLERAALLSGVALIQDRDWYFEGSMVLVGAQLENGAWPGEVLWDLDFERCAMAILFLKRGTLPVLTGK